MKKLLDELRRLAADAQLSLVVNWLSQTHADGYFVDGTETLLTFTLDDSAIRFYCRGAEPDGRTVARRGFPVDYDVNQILFFVRRELHVTDQAA